MDTLRQCARVGGIVLRFVWRGLMVYGITLTGARPQAHEPAPPPPPTDLPRLATPQLGRPPAGHPERLAAHVPPNRVERHLWRQLL